MLKNCFDQLLSLFLPRNCLCCQRQAQCPTSLCEACNYDLPRIDNPCVQCAQSLVGEVSERCGKCLSQPRYFDRAIIPFLYQSPISNFIQQLKFNQQIYLAKVLSHLLFCEIKYNMPAKLLPDLIIPVPLHIHRLRKRGFNQALLIAKPVAKQLKIPISVSLVERILNTEPQSQLAAKKRELNIKRAFVVHEQSLTNQFQPIGEIKRIAIVDDVMTTGNTVNEIAKALKKAGVKSVQVWCCARAV